MDFAEQIKEFSGKVRELKDSIKTEESTKLSIVIPFFSILGYDVSDPNEFVPEFTADFGTKKNEKVDFAIIIDGKPLILVETKCIDKNIHKHKSQLCRYFGASDAKFAVLTNGLDFHFFSDFDALNKMDIQPFLEINLLDLKENQIKELKKFCKTNFNLKEVLTRAQNLKYAATFKAIFKEELECPSDEFVKFFIGKFGSLTKTHALVEKLREPLKKSLNDYINDSMKEKLKDAFSPKNSSSASKNQQANTIGDFVSKSSSGVVTTEEELEAYFIIKNILKDIIPVNRISCRDTQGYFSVMYDNNCRKCICRLIFNNSRKEIAIPDFKKNFSLFKLENIYEINNYKNELIEVAKLYTEFSGVQS